MTAGSSSSSTIMLDLPLDSKKDEPAYGQPKKPKPSLRPHRKPLSAWIVAQKLILKTKGTRLPTVNSQKHQPESPKTHPSNKKTKSSKSTEDNAAKLTVKSTPPSADEKPTNKPKCYGLKITHHGIVRQPTNKKGRVCTCGMCGKKFKNSTLFITNYSTTHPSLNCKHCSKTYTNPISLQKHKYMHKAEKKTCDSCGKAFAFQSQLSDHWKTHLKTKLHICSHPNCSKDFTHRYDLLKHERTHKKGKHKCENCEYTTKDIRNLCQHARIDTGVTP